MPEPDARGYCTKIAPFMPVLAQWLLQKKPYAPGVEKDTVSLVVLLAIGLVPLTSATQSTPGRSGWAVDASMVTWVVVETLMHGGA